MAARWTIFESPGGCRQRIEPNCGIDGRPVINQPRRNGNVNSTLQHQHFDGIKPEASFRGGWGGPSPPPPRKKKKERKKEKREKKREKKRKRKKGTMNDVKLLHIKCCFFQFFNSLVALKNEKICWPPPKKLKWLK